MRLPAIPDPRDLANLIPRAFGLVASAEQLLDDVGALLRRIEGTRAAADDVVARVGVTVADADAMIARLDPPLTRLLPTLKRLAETTDPAEVDALVSLVNHLPMLVGRLENEIVPILDSLSSVAPDMHDLLDVTRELNEMIAKLPGMGRLRKKVDEEQAAEGRG